MRVTWDDYFLGIVNAVSKRATCNRGRSACVIVGENNNILATGYVGSPRQLEHCDDVGHELVDQLNDDGSISEHCIRTVHCEVNAVAQAARHGVKLDNATIYITMEPCYSCAKMIIQCGIQRVVCNYRYHLGFKSRQLFHKAGIQLKVKHEKVLEYEHDK